MSILHHILSLSNNQETTVTLQHVERAAHAAARFLDARRGKSAHLRCPEIALALAVEPLGDEGEEPAVGAPATIKRYITLVRPMYDLCRAIATTLGLSAEQILADEANYRKIRDLARKFDAAAFRPLANVVHARDFDRRVKHWLERRTWTAGDLIGHLVPRLEALLGSEHSDHARFFI